VEIAIAGEAGNAEVGGSLGSLWAEMRIAMMVLTGLKIGHAVGRYYQQRRHVVAR